MSNKGKGNNTKIVLNRQSDLILTGANIEKPVGIVLEDIKGVQETFEKEAKTRTAADDKLQGQIDNVLSNIDPESLDSLTEIVDAFKGADKDLNGAISDLAKSASSALEKETEAREEAIKDLSSNIYSDLKSEAKEREAADVAEVNAREAAIKDLSSNIYSDLKSEAKEREAADDKLQGQIDNVLSNVDPESLDSLTEVVEAFKVADKDLNGAISSLAKTASTALGQEAKTRAEADDKEAKTRAEADDKEAKTREAGDAELAKGLAEEISRATKAEEGLDSKIAGIISNTDLSSIDSFSEVVDNLNAEIKRAENAEDSITTRVDTEYYKKLNVIETPDGNLNRFTFSTWSRSSSESIFLNGLLLTEGVDYTIVSVSGNIAAVNFIDAPLVGDRVKAYGVYATDAVSVDNIRAQIAKIEMEIQETISKIADARNSINVTNQKLDSQTQKLNETAADMASFSAGSTQLVTEKVSIEETIAQHESELDAIYMEIVDETQNIDVYENRKADAEATIVNATNTRAGLEQILSQFESDKAQYLAATPSDELDQSIIDGFDSNIAEKTMEITIATGNIEVAEAEKAGAESDIANSQNNLVELRSTQSNKRDTLDQERATIEQIAKSLSDLTQKLAEATDKFNDLSKWIAIYNSDINKTKATVSIMESDVKKCSGILAGLQKQLADLIAVFGGGGKN